MRALIITKKEFDNDHPVLKDREVAYKANVDELLKACKDHGIEYTQENISNCDEKSCGDANYDIVIVIGGDGTLLSTHQFILNKPVLAIRGDLGSKGYLVQHSSPKKLIKKLVDNELKEEQWTRVCCPEKNLLGLNEIYIGNLYSTGYSEFRISDRLFSGSGLLFTTGSGSTAWFRALGEQPYDRCAEEIKFLMREASPGNELSGVILENQEYKVEVLIREHGIVSADGANPGHVEDKLHEVKYGEKLTIKHSTPLKCLVDPKDKRPA